MADDQRAFVVSPAEGRFIDLGAFEMTVKADAEDTAGVVSVSEAEEPPGFGPPAPIRWKSSGRRLNATSRSVRPASTG
jgi:hypothetical protein